MSNDFFVLGDYNCICAECGRKKKASQLKMNWKGFLVCPVGCWEPRHPQDFAKAATEDNQVSIVQAPGEPVFVDSDIPDYEPYDPSEGGHPG